MLESIRDAAKDDKPIYLFLDNATFHKSQEVKDKMKELKIIPVWNVAYKFKYNPCERLFSQYKQVYRKILLQKMLENPDPKSNPLKQSLNETFLMT